MSNLMSSLHLVVKLPVETIRARRAARVQTIDNFLNLFQQWRGHELLVVALCDQARDNLQELFIHLHVGPLK